MLRPIKELTPDPENARRHPPEQMDALKAALSKFGLRKPLVIDADGTVIVGNARLAAAAMLGWTHVPVIVFTGDERERTALAVVENRSQELGVWNDTALNAALESLDKHGLELGFSEEEIAERIGALNDEETVLPPGSPTGAHYRENPYKDTGKEEEEKDEEPAEEAQPRTKYKQIQVFVPTPKYEDFMARVAELSESYGTESVTETLFRYVTEQANV